jgi:hypothetical protein
MTTSLRYENNVVIHAINLPPADVGLDRFNNLLELGIDDDWRGPTGLELRGSAGFRHELSREL